ncbi:hypothetical protein Tcan_02927 [Toxocara canis]|uniref:Uncharacterized protein n=1 Tax=Toxocara canis TaxID=6265 RepID=A0A0B2V2R9_TOXCA|nr:hypothetical protein Tcan_02927 [Toxocara canis]
MAVRICDMQRIMTALTEPFVLMRTITTTNTPVFGFAPTTRFKRTNKLLDQPYTNMEGTRNGNLYTSNCTTILGTSGESSQLSHEIEPPTTKDIQKDVGDFNDEQVRVLHLNEKRYYKVVVWRDPP